MSKKPLFILIGFLLIIFLLGKYTTWQLERWKKSLPEEFPKIEPEEFQTIPQFSPTGTYPFSFPTSTYPFPESFSYPGLTPSEIPQSEVSQPEGYKEFVSPDGKLKIKYPSNWFRLEVESFQKTVPEEWVKNYQMKILFLTQKLETERSAQLIISQMIVDAQMEIEKLVEEIKKVIEKQGWEMEIMEFKTGEKECLFEAKYKKQNSPTLHSKEKILLLNPGDNQRKIFLVEFIASEKDWEYLENEGKEILNTIQLINNL
ncbi:hypothetical protein AMJ49_00305 [Parcubacteria bacterium DG_74_2]|nr:MAG: hypothetical protein AMJ49_00305 [Parcubacteria bacterium DG_74_2]